MKNITKYALNTAIIIFLITGIIWVASMFIHIGSVEYTDNAQVYERIVPVNSRITGYIKEIRFDDFQYVHKGDTLLIIDNTEYALKVAQCLAAYNNALVDKNTMHTTIRTTENDITVSDANLLDTKIQLDNAMREYSRYNSMLKNEAVTQQQFDAVKTRYESLKARYEAQKRQRQSMQLIKSQQTQRLEQNEGNIAMAEASLRLAELNLSYTVITAPCNGYTSRKNIEEGTLVQPGQKLLSVVNNEEVWVIANYRECQMKNITVGSDIEITIDALDGIKFSGKVSAISEATGAQYSVVPQDNAVGNFVKIEQKIPVKIVFDNTNSAQDMKRLQSGMNASCKVKHNND